MRRMTAAVGSAAFFVAGPGTVAGLVPWWLTRWRVRYRGRWALPLRAAGAGLIGAGGAVLGNAFVRFAAEGRGTPVPAAPPEHLVVGGYYRYVRNPMYVALGAIVVGQALLQGQPKLLLYAAGAAVPAVTFVRGYEEPKLRALFGAEYDTYRAAVPGWIPRPRPWHGDATRRA